MLKLPTPSANTGTTIEKIMPLLALVCSLLIVNYAAAQDVELADVNALFDFADREYPDYFAPATVETSDSITGWLYRYYPGTDSYIAVSLQDTEDYVRGGVYVLGGLFGSEAVYIDLLSNLLTLLDGADGAVLSGSISPFQLIEIEGSFDPQNSAISVLLTHQSTGVTVTVPVLSATATAVEFLMPPLVDRASGEVVQGRVDVEILQAGLSVVTRTEILGSPLILEPSAVESVFSRGDWTIAYLLSALDSLTVADELSTALNLGSDAAEALAGISFEMESLLDKVQTLVASGATQSLTTGDGAVIQMDGDDLDMLDRLIASYFTRFNADASDSQSLQVKVTSASRPPAAQSLAALESAASRCRGNEGIPGVMEFVCGPREAKAQNAVIAGEELRKGAKFVYGLPLSLSSIPAGSLVGGGVAISMLISASYAWLADHLAQTPTTIASTLEAILVGRAGSVTGIKPLGEIYSLVKTFASITGEIDGSDPADHAPEKGAVQVNWALTDSQGKTVVTRTPADGSDSIHLILPPSDTSASVSSQVVVTASVCDENCVDLGADFSLAVTSEMCTPRNAYAGDPVNVVRVEGTVSGPVETGLNTPHGHFFEDHNGFLVCADWTFCIRDSGEPEATTFSFTVLAERSLIVDDEVVFPNYTLYSIELERDFVAGYDTNVSIERIFSNCPRQS